MRRMKRSFTLMLVLFCAVLSSSAQTTLWQHTEHTLSLLNGTNIVWQIVADPAQGKPYFHPLATPGGIVLTDLRPSDHPWHRGLWWSWKYINGPNYWEEDPETARSEASTELTAARLEPHDGGSATLSFDLNYRPWQASPVLTERRIIQISSPTNGSYELLWSSTFTPRIDAYLERTPPPDEPHGVAWGGYAGLSLRLNPKTRGWTFSNAQGLSGVAALHGHPSAWVKFSAGAGHPAITVFDDPRNPRYPCPWYVNQDMPYFSPALLFHAPMKLAAGEQLTLRYRIVITDHDAGEKEQSSTSKSE